jgi:hypothetical protein
MPHETPQRTRLTPIQLGKAGFASYFPDTSPRSRHFFGGLIHRWGIQVDPSCRVQPRVLVPKASGRTAEKTVGFSSFSSQLAEISPVGQKSYFLVEPAASLFARLAINLS